MHLDGSEDEVRWYKVSSQGLPPERSSCSGGYNAARGEVYFGMGNSHVGVYQDLVSIKVHGPAETP